MYELSTRFDADIGCTLGTSFMHSSNIPGFICVFCEFLSQYSSRDYDVICELGIGKSVSCDVDYVVQARIYLWNLYRNRVDKGLDRLLGSILLPFA